LLLLVGPGRCNIFYPCKLLSAFSECTAASHELGLNWKIPEEPSCIIQVLLSPKLSSKVLYLEEDKKGERS